MGVWTVECAMGFGGVICVTVLCGFAFGFVRAFFVCRGFGRCAFLVFLMRFGELLKSVSGILRV